MTRHRFLSAIAVMVGVAVTGWNAAISAADTPATLQTPQNLLRNGSFEGGLLYWHGIEPDKQHLVRGAAAVGEYALRIDQGYVMSAPFAAQPGQPVTVSFFVKGDKPGVVDVSMPPSAREPGQKAQRLWAREAGQRAKFGTQWQRVSFTWNADVPQDGFWPYPHYMVQLGGGDSSGPFLVDGVTVTQGRQGTPAYVPRRAVEIIADCPDLPGFGGGKANLLERGAAPRITALASNPGTQPRTVRLRWQLFDYEGQRAISDPVDKQVTLAPGKTRSETMPLPLTATGLVLARVSVLEGDTEIDHSDFPLTTLPYPKAATKPDWRERFGGSFAGGTGCVEKLQRIGFGWIRWRPHANGEDHLPQKPGAAWQWHWFDKELNEQEAHGCAAHCVLYPPPAWIMEKGQPLPLDMRWPAADPRWEDLAVETVWDKFIKGAVAHYKGRALIYEIENEPEFDGWDNFKDEYVKFTTRTARLIKQTDPAAKVMVDNVYGIPSGLNAAFFQAGGLKYIDVMSWHDYHEGWLAEATALRRMRQNIDEAGGRHVEIWFNEGWTFTNTAVDEPIACTHLTSAQSTNAIADSVAELTANGQDKTILFHTSYEDHGMSFWDYSGPGTLLWDWYNYPLPLVAAWNVLAEHIGVSAKVAFVRPPGANFCIFEDQRHGRGVMIAYADRDAHAAAAVELPDCGTPLQAEDIMGNVAPAPRHLVLSQTGRPVILYAANGKVSGRAFADKMANLDRKNARFVSTGDGGPVAWTLPPAWEGRAKGQSDGSVALADGKSIWKLEQVWPPDWKKPENFRPMMWTGTDWNVKDGGFGGQPGAALDGRVLNFGTRAAHGTPPQRRMAGLSFVAPQAGTYQLSGTAECHIWDGQSKTILRLLHKSAAGVEEVDHVTIAHNGSATLETLHVTLAAGEEFTLLPEIEGMYNGGDCKLRDLRVTCSGATNAVAAAPVFRLPAAWEGSKKGSADGNPIGAAGRPVWRIDRVYPDQYIMAENYAPVPWDGTAWHPEDHQQGGQPGVRVENGAAHISVSGPWQNLEFQKIAGLVFIVPKDGVYRVRGTANSKPWTGGARTFRLAVLKKDTQRAAAVKMFDLPRAGQAVEMDFNVELTAGHELVFLPLMPDWNNATTTTLENLSIQGP